MRGIEAGADDFLSKPVDERELLARIRTALSLKRAIDETVGELRSTSAHLERYGRQERDVAVLAVEWRLARPEPAGGGGRLRRAPPTGRPPRSAIRALGGTAERGDARPARRRVRGPRCAQPLACGRRGGARRRSPSGSTSADAAEVVHERRDQRRRGARSARPGSTDAGDARAGSTARRASRSSGPRRSRGQRQRDGVLVADDVAAARRATGSRSSRSATGPTACSLPDGRPRRRVGCGPPASAAIRTILVTDIVGSTRTRRAHRRSRLGRARRGARASDQGRARRLRRRGDRHDGRRLPRVLRQPGARDPLRARADRPRRRARA